MKVPSLKSFSSLTCRPTQRLYVQETAQPTGSAFSLVFAYALTGGLVNLATRQLVQHMTFVAAKMDFAVDSMNAVAMKVGWALAATLPTALFEMIVMEMGFVPFQ